MTQSLRQILVVDTDAGTRERIKSLLQDNLVFTAGDYEEARLILEHQPGIVMVICDAAVGDGRLVQFCRRRRPEVVQVLLARRTYLALRAHRVDFGTAFRVISKPFDDSQIGEAVQEGLRHAAGERGETGREPGAGAVREAPTRYDMEAMDEMHDMDTAAAQHLLSSDLELRDEWMRVVAHDIRSPLSIINGYAAFLLEHESGLSNEGADVLNRIRNTGQRLLNLLNNILTLASLEEGKLQLECTPSRISDIFSAVVEDLQGLADAHDVSLQARVEGEEGLHNLDHIKVEQVLQNLVSNGIKYSPSGGTVSLVCRPGPQEVRFEVTDSGPGLTGEQIAHVFDKFSRYAAAGHEGSGLGLAIAKALVQLHGGRIWVDSEVGQGSTFAFTIIPQPDAVCGGR